MLPLIEDGEILHVQRAYLPKLRVGDIVLFRKVQNSRPTESSGRRKTCSLPAETRVCKQTAQSRGANRGQNGSQRMREKWRDGPIGWSGSSTELVHRGVPKASQKISLAIVWFCAASSLSLFRFPSDRSFRSLPSGAGRSGAVRPHLCRQCCGWKHGLHGHNHRGRVQRTRGSRFHGRGIHQRRE